MSQFLDNMNIGETIDFRGPLGLLTHQGPSRFAVKPHLESPAIRVTFKKLNMIAGKYLY